MRLAPFLAALSLATDAAAGLAPRTAQRTALLAVRIAGLQGWSAAERSAVYYAGLLRFLGCTGFATETAAWAGDADELALLAALSLADGTNPVDVLRRAAASTRRRAGLGAAARTVWALGKDPSGARSFAEAHCAQAVALGGDLGLADVAPLLAQMLERWDGRGHPAGVRGEVQLPGARVLATAFRAEVLRSAFGWAEGRLELRRRAGTELDPAIVEVVEGIDPAELDEEGLTERLLDREPHPHREVRDAGDLARTFARYVDLKSTYTLGHSVAVGRLVADSGAGGTAVQAALLHDLGRCGVPNALWDRPGPLSPVDRARVAEHAWHTERILRADAVTLPLAEIAARHHERLDGSGYPRQSRSADLSEEARVLGAADVFVALLSPRPWRPALRLEDAVRTLSEEAGAHRLDRRAVDAVLAAAGLPRTRRALPDGLSPREAEALAWAARGLSNKEIGARLGVSPVTVKNHLLRAYDKTGVRTRAAAALYAVRNELIDG